MHRTFLESLHNDQEPTLWQNWHNMFNAEQYPQQYLTCDAYYDSQFWEIRDAYIARLCRANEHHDAYTKRLDYLKAQFKANLNSKNAKEPRRIPARFKTQGKVIAARFSKLDLEHRAALIIQTWNAASTGTLEEQIAANMAANHKFTCKEPHSNGLPRAWKKLPVAQNPLHALHDPHISEEDPTMLAYTQSVDKLRRNIQTRTRPGKYLHKFYPELTAEDVKKYAEAFAAHGKTPELKFIENDDPDGWEDIYERGPTSCMQGESCVKVYARPGNHLRLAYLEEDGEVVARAIVRTDLNQYVRAYPRTDSEAGQIMHTRMVETLTQAGFAYGNLDGIHINTWEDDGRWVAPYIDSGRNGGQCGELRYKKPEVTGQTPEYFVLGQGDFELDETSGYARGGGEPCDICGDRMDEDDSNWVESTEQTVCQHCLDHRFTYAYGRRYQDYYPEDEVVYCESDGESYYIPTLGYHDIAECCRTGNYYSTDDMVCLDHGSDEGEYCHVDEAKQLPDGTWCLDREYDDLMEELFPEPEEDSEDEVEPEVELAQAA